MLAGYCSQANFAILQQNSSHCIAWLSDAAACHHGQVIH